MEIEPAPVAAAEIGSTSSQAEPKGERLTFTVNFKKQSYEITFGSEDTVNALRLHLMQLTGVAAGLQKLMFKGMLKDDKATLAQAGIKNGVKIMMMGSTIDEVMAASAAPPAESGPKSEAESEKASEEPLSEQLPHKKMIDKGPPEGLELAKLGKHEPLPPTSIQNILNNTGQKVRLTFKTFSGELWLQSSTNTQKLPFASIQKVTSEPIKGNEGYHIMALHLGPNSKYWLYWVPCQYARAIRNTIMADYTYG